jgi:hypothetical protein
MFMRWEEEPFGPQVRVQFWMGVAQQRLAYTGSMVLAPDQWEAMRDALVLGEAKVLEIAGPRTLLFLPETLDHAAGT